MVFNQNIAFDHVRSLIVAAVGELESRTLTAEKARRAAERIGEDPEVAYRKTLERTSNIRKGLGITGSDTKGATETARSDEVATSNPNTPPVAVKQLRGDSGTRQ